MKKIKVVAIVGPTASGKTALSISLAKRLQGEIVSFDSMQIYKDMDIGTAKPTVEERDGVPHHMFDLVEPSCVFSCADYAEKAHAVIADIHARGKLPILVGGTGLYLESVLYGMNFEKPGEDAAIRARLAACSKEELWERLVAIDPVSAAQMHKNNTRRVIRALEIYEITGKTKSELDAMSSAKESRYDVQIFGIDYVNRAELCARIDRRVEQMLQDGLLAEVRRVRPNLSETAKQAIGYKELLAYLDGEESLESAVETIKIRTHQYAKRQRTWFMHMQGVQWYRIDTAEKQPDFEEIVNFFVSLFTKSL